VFLNGLDTGATTHEISRKENGKTLGGATTDACRHHHGLGRKYEFYTILYGNVGLPEENILSATPYVHG
jgi:hypothetical protein